MLGFHLKLLNSEDLIFFEVTGATNFHRISLLRCILLAMV